MWDITCKPHSHDHKVLGHVIIGYPKSALSHAAGGAWPWWASQKNSQIWFAIAWHFRKTSKHIPNIFDLHDFHIYFWKPNPTRQLPCRLDHCKYPNLPKHQKQTQNQHLKIFHNKYILILKTCTPWTSDVGISLRSPTNATSNTSNFWIWYSFGDVGILLILRKRKL